METIEKIRKENYNYLAEDKKCNKIDLELYYFYDYIEEKEGDSEHEQELLAIMEREVNQLRYTIECYKKEHDQNHWNKIEQLKKEAE